MSRAVLVPSIGDPFLINLWYKLCHHYWIKEVDKIYISIDSHNEPLFGETAKYFDTLAEDKKFKIIYNDDRGMATNFEKVFNACQENYFAFVQEDAFIFKSGELDRQFRKLEIGIVDVIGTPMQDYTSFLSNDLAEQFNIHNRFLLERGLSLWQNFLFGNWKMWSLAKPQFAPISWKKGTKIEWLDNYKLPEDANLDILVETIFKLRKYNAKFSYVAQTLMVTIDAFRYLDINFWIHVNNLSSIMGFIVGDFGELKFSDDIRHEMIRRVSWWCFAYKSSLDLKQIIPNFANEYLNAIEKVKEIFRIQHRDIENQMQMIGDLLWQ